MEERERREERKREKRKKKKGRRVKRRERGKGRKGKGGVCVLLLQDLVQSCSRGGGEDSGGTAEDMCYESEVGHVPLDVRNG